MAHRASQCSAGTVVNRQSGILTRFIQVAEGAVLALRTYHPAIRWLTVRRNHLAGLICTCCELTPSVALLLPYASSVAH